MRKYCKSVVDNGIDGRTLLTCQSVEEIKELGIDITVKARMLFDELSILKSIVPVRNSLRVCDYYLNSCYYYDESLMTRLFTFVCIHKPTELRL